MLSLSGDWLLVQGSSPIAPAVGEDAVQTVGLLRGQPVAFRRHMCRSQTLRSTNFQVWDMLESHNACQVSLLAHLAFCRNSELG